MNYTISLIDIDSMFYQAANLSSLEECIVKFKEKLNNCLVETKCTHWAGFTSKGKTFRHELFKLYKSKRTQPPPKYLFALKEWAIVEYNLNVSIGFEADDALAYNMKNPIHYWRVDEVGESDATFDYDKIMCAIDKDLLLSIPGKHFNYTYKLVVKDDPSSVIKGWWVETNEVNAEKFKWVQVLMGDNSDCVDGLSGVGIKRATEIIDNIIEIKGYLPEGVLSNYISHHRDIPKAIFEYQKNYRLLHMLDCDEDFIREVGSLPDFPNINVVEQKIEEVKIDIENVF